MRADRDVYLGRLSPPCFIDSGAGNCDRSVSRTKSVSKDLRASARASAG